jgi:hypothetical protein
MSYMLLFTKTSGQKLLINRYAICRYWETATPGVCDVEYTHDGQGPTKIKQISVCCPFNLLDTKNMLVFHDNDTGRKVAILRTDILMVEEANGYACDVTYYHLDASSGVCYLSVVGDVEKIMRNFEEA